MMMMRQDACGNTCGGSGNVLDHRRRTARSAPCSGRLTARGEQFAALRGGRWRMGSAGSVLQRQGSGRWRQLHCSAPSARQRTMRRAKLQRRRLIVSRPPTQRGRPGAWFGRMRRRMLMTPSTRCTNAGRTVAAFKQLGSSLVCRRAMGCAVFMGRTGNRSGVLCPCAIVWHRSVADADCILWPLCRP